MKKFKLPNLRKLITVALIVAIYIVYTLTSNTSNLQVLQAEATVTDYVNAYMLLEGEDEVPSYQRFLNIRDIKYTLVDQSATLENIPHSESFNYDSDVALLTSDNTVTYEVEMDEQGLYQLNLDYFIEEEQFNDVIISININGMTQYDESQLVILPLKWQDISKDYELDRYQDELPPSHERIVGWDNQDLYDNRYTTSTPLLFELSEGANTIEISTKVLHDVYLGNLDVVAPKELISYNDYLSQYPEVYPDVTYELNAIDYVEKNTPFVRADSLSTPDVTPFENTQKKINILSGWEDSGQSITFEIEVTESGLYDIYTHGVVNEYDFSIFKTVLINGEIPFEEARSLEITETNEDFDISDFGYKFYLPKGTNTITFKNEISVFAQAIDDMDFLINHINTFSLDVRKASGSNLDEDRTWNFTTVIPETESYLEAYETIIQYNIVRLSQYAETADTSYKLSYLNSALRTLQQVMEEPDDLPLFIDDLYMGSGSVNQLLGDTITFISSTSYTLDLVIISNDDQNNYNASFWDRTEYFFASFFESFNSERYTLNKDSEALQIWVSRQTTYVDIMQKMIDKDFTPQTGIEVDLSVTPSVDKLVLSSAAGNTPDGALGLPSYVPYKLALRGTLVDLTTFDDFWTYSADKFAPGAYIPYAINDAVYAMPETLTFQALIYREDIFEQIDGLEVPDTWDDVIGLLPNLQNYDMNFYYPTAGGTSIKWFYQTTPFIYQNGGQIYADNGFEVGLTSPEAIEGIDFLGKLFTTYSLPEQVPSFYNDFRYSSLPVGIIDFNTYVMIKNAAPELEGKWSLAPYPGTLDEETGIINRSYVGNGTGGIIFEASERQEDVWTFFKWWQEEDTQTTFAYDLYTTYGPTYLWLPANYNAIDNLPIDDEDKAVIKDSIKWLRDVPRTPGQYMVERGLSDIWNEMVYDGYSARYAIDRQVLIMNREIRIKMEEFGFLDEDGNMIKEYSVRDYDYFYQKFLENGLVEEE